MKKALNRPDRISKDDNHTDQTLPRSKILRGQQNFQRLFETSLVLKSPAIHLRYRLYDDPGEGCLIGFIAKKKLGKAVERNRTKRVLREAYRTNQYLLSDLFDTQTVGFHGVLIPRKAGLPHHIVQTEMVALLKRMRVILTDHLSPKNINTHTKK
ncbi:MAG: ribonuclease P protein component [Balneolaceae bacterium]